MTNYLQTHQNYKGSIAHGPTEDIIFNGQEQLCEVRGSAQMCVKY